MSWYLVGGGRQACNSMSTSKMLMMMLTSKANRKEIIKLIKKKRTTTRRTRTITRKMMTRSWTTEAAQMTTKKQMLLRLQTLPVRIWLKMRWQGDPCKRDRVGQEEALTMTLTSQRAIITIICNRSKMYRFKVSSLCLLSKG